VSKHKNPRRLITAPAEIFAKWDAVARLARVRSWARWARMVLNQVSTLELERAGLEWSSLRSRVQPLSPLAGGAARSRDIRSTSASSSGRTADIRPARSSSPTSKRISAAAAGDVVHLVDRDHARVSCGARNWLHDSRRRRDVTCKNCVHAAGIGRRR